ncbi:MAG: hypothetical protein AAB358_03820 [Patescibacteria group bacterium]
MSNPEKPKIITPEGEEIVGNDRPEDAEEKLKIQKRRDAMIAKALQEGDSERIMAIREMPDEAFQREEKIIEFPKRKRGEKEETA